MIFACDRCGRRYSVPDERVQGRAFRATCKACGNAIVVRPDRPSTPQPPAAAAAVGTNGSASATASPAPAPRPAEPPPPLPSAPAVDPFADLAAELEAERRGATPARLAPPAPAQAVPARPTPPAPPVQPEPPPLTASARPGSAADPFGDASAPTPSAELPLTTGEIAWMTTGEVGLVRPPVGGAPARPEPRGPGVLRVALAAVLLGLGAAGAVWLLRPSRVAAPAAPPLAAAAHPRPSAQPAAPAAEPTPEPEPAVAPTLAEAEAAPAPPPVAAEPASAVRTRHSTSSAHFEPGSVTVVPSRRKEAQRLSRKDRKLLDLLSRKGDQAPPEPVEKLDLDTGRSLDPAAVERVVAEGQGAFSGCISRTARPGEAASRRTTLLLTVSSSGAVSSAWLAEAELSRTSLGRCVVAAARRLAFPAFEGAPVDVSVPLVLDAR